MLYEVITFGQRVDRQPHGDDAVRIQSPATEAEIVLAVERSVAGVAGVDGVGEDDVELLAETLQQGDLSRRMRVDWLRKRGVKSPKLRSYNFV